MSEPHKRERRKRPVVPVAVSLRGYQLAWLRGDLLAGIAVAAFLVPQVMAYAQVAGVPPVAGLWAALPALVTYAVLGSSRSLSSRLDTLPSGMRGRSVRLLEPSTTSRASWRAAAFKMATAIWP